jgi:hypothetical protein
MTMTERWLEVVSDARSEGASNEAIDAAASQLGIDLPPDYRAVMRAANGGDSEFGESWIVLWDVEDLVERNAGYQVTDLAPGFTFFGSNGAGEAYAWDWRIPGKLRYVVIPFIVPEPEAAVPCGETFEEFLSVLHQGIPFDRAGES